MAGMKTPQRDIFADMRDEIGDLIELCEDLANKVVERHGNGKSHLEPRLAALPLFTALLNILKAQGHLDDSRVQGLRHIAAKHQR